MKYTPDQHQHAKKKFVYRPRTAEQIKQHRDCSLPWWKVQVIESQKAAAAQRALRKARKAVSDGR
jgi:hypothetical protein